MLLCCMCVSSRGAGRVIPTSMLILHRWVFCWRRYHASYCLGYLWGGGSGGGPTEGLTGFKDYISDFSANLKPRSSGEPIVIVINPTFRTMEFEDGLLKKDEANPLKVSL